MKRPTLQIALLSLLLATLLGCQLAVSLVLLDSMLHAESHVRQIFLLNRFSTRIDRILPDYRNHGIRRGDELVALNGVPVDGDDQIDREWKTGRPNDLVNVTVRRQSAGQWETQTIPVRLRADAPNATAWVLIAVDSCILPISCILVGFYIAFARPRDTLAWITMAMLVSFGQLVGDNGASLLASPLRQIVRFYQPILNTTWPLWLLLFSFYFPISFEFIKRNRWLVWLLAVPCVALAAVDIYGNFEQGEHLQQLAWLARFEKSAHTPVVIWFTLYVCAFFFFLGWKRHILTALDARRRIRLMSVGCTVSLLPTLAVFLSDSGFLPRFPFWLFTCCLSLLLFFPITMGYVIVVQRAMDVRMVVRSGVQYAFARTGVRILSLGIATAVVILTVQFAQQSGHQITALAISAVGFLLVFAIIRLSKRLRVWVDRRFFREDYNAELLLTDLSGSVAGIRDPRVLVETVAKRISESLHVPRIAVFLDRGGIYQPAYALGFPAPAPPFQFTQEAGTVRYLKRQLAPSKVYFEDPQSWVHGTPSSEQETLRTLNTQLLLPMSLKSRLMGIISLGGKRSEEPYSRADIQLLNAVASQTGLALENAELTESVRHEIAQRERLDRELEIAREVQQRLFPQKLPIVSGLDFAGYCRPAEGVGGDYYDFIHLPDGCLGIAVGDVSGKGIAAALMMASLQASLRGQTIKPCETLSEMIEHINQLVYDASASNRYATFFYAQYNPATLKLRYVNAGHNPPLVCRRVDGKDKFQQLDEGGTVVGLFQHSPFCEASVQLEKGDLVVAYTDGISEAMTATDEEFSEDRLTQALSQCQARSAAEIVTYILNEVDAFTAGAKQHDDMTLVVLRVH